MAATSFTPDTTDNKLPSADVCSKGFLFGSAEHTVIMPILACHKARAGGNSLITSHSEPATAILTMFRIYHRTCASGPSSRVIFLISHLAALLRASFFAIITIERPQLMNLVGCSTSTQKPTCPPTCSRKWTG